MGRVTRRAFLQAAAVATGGLVLRNSYAAGAAAAAETPPSHDISQKYVTCFYQWNDEALKTLGDPDRGLPNGDQFLHLFTRSHAGHEKHAKVARSVRALGPSFKYALAIDAHKYPDWRSAPADQLRQWAIQFRDEALPDAGPSDYFAFNEMPTGAEGDPRLQRQIATWMRYLHDPNDGRPALRGVFYFVEENLDPASWKGDASDELFAVLDETCDLVVGEHYHDKAFVYGRTPEQYAKHLFALPRWLDASGNPAKQHVARDKYAVLHSTFYAPKKTPWEGLQKGVSSPEEFREYLKRVVDCTRIDPYGRRRIAFGPLAAGQMETSDVVPPLADVLHEDAMRFKG